MFIYIYIYTERSRVVGHTGFPQCLGTWKPSLVCWLSTTQVASAHSKKKQTTCRSGQTHIHLEGPVKLSVVLMEPACIYIYITINIYIYYNIGIYLEIKSARCYTNYIIDHIVTHRSKSFNINHSTTPIHRTSIQRHCHCFNFWDVAIAIDRVRQI